MTFLALGINHNTASVAVRENLSFAPEDLPRALDTIVGSGLVSEVAMISTCNRTEIYCETHTDSEALVAWLGAYKGVPSQDLLQACYVHEGEAAARHMMKVASGLDSLVLGEPQILGQMKSCYAQADAQNVLGPHLYSTFQQVFAVAKRVRSETAIGENPVSVAYAAVSLAKQIFSDLTQDTVLLVGAGETIELVARHMYEQGVKKILVANRTLQNAEKLAAEFGGKAILLGDIPEYLREADILISSTASTLPLIGKGMVEKALKQRKHKPIFMVDIAVPRDIEEQVGQLSDVFLYSVDDLKEVIDENRRSREKAAKIAEEIIDEGVIKYRAELHARGAVDIIRSFREHVSNLRDSELERALRQIKNGQDPEQVLEKFAHTLSNKFMHEPMTKIKSADAEQNESLRATLKSLFSLSNTDDK